MSCLDPTTILNLAGIAAVTLICVAAFGVLGMLVRGK